MNSRQGNRRLRWKLRAAILATFALCGLGSLVAAGCESALAFAPARALSVSPFTSSTLPASASSLYKTGIDLTTKSEASTQPGHEKEGQAGGGDTIEWVLHYENTSGALAEMNLTDPILDGQTFKPGSLKTPPGFAPQYTTAAGGQGEYKTGTEPSGVTGVGAYVGSENEGGADKVTPPLAKGRTAEIPYPLTTNFEAQGSGDGFEPLLFEGNVYNDYHHTAPPTLECHEETATGKECPGYPLEVAASGALEPGEADSDESANAASGDFVTSGHNTGVITPEGNWYIPVEVVGTETTKLLCVDLHTKQMCPGYPTILDEHSTPPGLDFETEQYASITADRELLHGDLYTLDGAGEIVCSKVTPTGEACPAPYSPGFKAYTQSPPLPFSGSLKSDGNDLIAINQRAGGGLPELACENASTHADCAGWPAAPIPTPDLAGTSTAPEYASLVIPDPTGDGICQYAYGKVGSGPYTSEWVCRSLASGEKIETPSGLDEILPPPSAALDAPGYYYLGEADYAEYDSRVLIPFRDENSPAESYVACFDWSTGHKCAGAWPKKLTTSTPDDNVRAYALTSDPSNPSCIYEDGDAQKLLSFSAITGEECTESTGTSVTVTPAQSYCGTTNPQGIAWDNVNISNLPAGATAYVTVKNASDEVVSGFEHVAVTANGPLSLGNIPYTNAGTTQSLTAYVEVTGLSPQNEPAGTPPVAVSLTFSSPEPVEVCFQTIVPENCQATAGSVTNEANVLTTGTNGDTDGPGGKSSGEVKFSVAPNSGSSCPPPPATGYDTSITKLVNGVAQGSGGFSEATVKLGEAANFTVAVKNAGPGKAAGQFITDTLEPELEYVGYKTDAKVSGCEYEAANRWLKCEVEELAEGETAEVTVETKVKSTAAAGITIPNTAYTGVAPEGGLNHSNQPVIGTGNTATTNSSTAKVNTPTETTPPPPVTGYDTSIKKLVNGVAQGSGGFSEATLKPGEAADFAIAVKNSGKAKAVGQFVTDTISPELEYVGVKRDAKVSGCEYEAANRWLKCTVEELAEGETAEITVETKVKSTAAAGITIPNTAYTGVAPTGGLNHGNTPVIGTGNTATTNSSTAKVNTPGETTPPPSVAETPTTTTATTTTPPPATTATTTTVTAPPVPHGSGSLTLAEVALVKTSRATVVAGGRITFHLKVSNPGTATLHDVQVCDDLPAGLVYVSSKSKAKLHDGDYCWTVATLNGRASKAFAIVTRALVGAFGKLTNRATASGPEVLTAHAHRTITVLRKPTGSGSLKVSSGGVTG
jgi:uncharacterized repeat protein (TIGR01451 family)/fimbrial isopeptide formation D2 family protein